MEKEELINKVSDKFRVFLDFLTEDELSELIDEMDDNPEAMDELMNQIRNDRLMANC